MMKEPCGCEDEHDGPGLDPVQITGKVTGTMRTNAEAADHGSYTSFAFLGTTVDIPVQVLGRDNDRARALISTTSVTGVYVGKMEQINSRDALGAVTTNGWLQTAAMQPLEIRNKQPVWVMSTTGAACVVSVMNERWDSARID